MLLAATQTDQQQGVRVGPLLIDAECQPVRVLDGIGWTLACGGTITNASGQVVAVDAKVQTVDGSAAAQEQQKTLAPGASTTLTDPGSGNRWVVTALSQEQAGEILIGVAAVGAVVGGLALYGLYAAGRDVAHRLRGRRERRAAGR
jgi:hypothetical protein